jgi:hypothetical protein
MTREELIKKVSADGYSVDFTLQDDCLYCSATDKNYILENFEVIMDYEFTENGQNKKLRTVASTEYGLTGYYII